MNVTQQVPGLLYVKDLQQLFRCGESKARLMMDELPTVLIGSRRAVLTRELNRYLAENESIKVKWPSRRR